MGALALQARPRTPSFFRIARRIADRFAPSVASAFLAGLRKFERQIDPVDLQQAVASGSVRQIEAAVASGGNFRVILEGSDMERRLLGTATATGTAGAEVLEGATGLGVQFNRMHPRVVMFARHQTATLVVEITEHVRESIRIVTALGQGAGLTTAQQARAIREVIGLPSVWANAPLNLRQQIFDGDVAGATARRLSAVDKAAIRSRIAKGTVDEAFVAGMQARYTASLINRRAQNIARTETLRASHAGQREGWKQAVEQRVLPKTVRRMWVVTPDSRLSFEHAEIPGLNPDGRGLDEPFNTPDGPFLDPPTRPNCRCGTGLLLRDRLL